MPHTTDPESLRYAFVVSVLHVESVLVLFPSCFSSHIDAFRYRGEIITVLDRPGLGAQAAMRSSRSPCLSSLFLVFVARDHLVYPRTLTLVLFSSDPEPSRVIRVPGDPAVSSRLS